MGSRKTLDLCWTPLFRQYIAKASDYCQVRGSMKAVSMLGIGCLVF